MCSSKVCNRLQGCGYRGSHAGLNHNAGNYDVTFQTCVSDVADFSFYVVNEGLGPQNTRRNPGVPSGTPNNDSRLRLNQP